MYINLPCCCKLLWNYSHQNRSDIRQHPDKLDHYLRIQNCRCFHKIPDCWCIARLHHTCQSHPHTHQRRGTSVHHPGSLVYMNSYRKQQCFFIEQKHCNYGCMNYTHLNLDIMFHSFRILQR